MDSRFTWTEEEGRLLVLHYPYKTWKELVVLIPSHTRDAIRIRAKELKIRKNLDPLNRFVTFVKKDKNGCWNWIGGKCRGYGHFKCGGKTFIAHRWIFERLVKKIPQDLTIDHICRNPSCVNVKHLRIMTAIENVMIGNAPSAKNARKTHCKRGHEFSKNNLVGNNKKQRRCKKCHNETSRQNRLNFKKEKSL